MKIALVLLAVVACAAAASVDSNDERSITAAVIDVILAAQKQMPCGFPDLGIPSLAAFKIPEKHVDIDTPALKLKGSVRHFELKGLNDFKIEKLTVNPLTRKATFRFTFENINVTTDYDLDMVLKKAGFTVHQVGRGNAKFGVNDIQVWGSLKYSLSILTGKLQLKTLEVRTHIKDVDSDITGILGDGKINNKMNDILEDAVVLAVNGQEDYISELIETYILPYINKFLNTVTLKEFVGAIRGSDDDVKAACIPPSS